MTDRRSGEKQYVSHLPTLKGGGGRGGGWRHNHKDTRHGRVFLFRLKQKYKRNVLFHIFLLSALIEKKKKKNK